MWQTTQSSYTVNPNPTTLPLQVSGVVGVTVPNNGQTLLRTYHFSSGDPTTITSLSTGIRQLGVCVPKVAMSGLLRARCPPGLNFTSGGIITGTPTVAGRFPITLFAADNVSLFPAFTTLTLTVVSQ